MVVGFFKFYSGVLGFSCGVFRVFGCVVGVCGGILVKQGKWVFKYCFLENQPNQVGIKLENFLMYTLLELSDL